MFVLVGIAIVFVSILTGYTMHGGKVAALMQYTEFIIIGGSAFGSVVIGYGINGAMGVMKSMTGLLKGNPYTKQTYLELLQAVYEVFLLARVEGLLALEKHVENPAESEVFQKHASFANESPCHRFVCGHVEAGCYGWDQHI